MQNPPKQPNPTPQPHRSTVFVDVFAWLQAIELHQTLIMEGVFRHAEQLCKLYTPAYHVGPNEKGFSLFAVATLQAHLGKAILNLPSVELIAEHGCKFWLSPAVDFPAPFLSRTDLPFKKVAIMHDTLAAQGHFNQAKPDQFRFGAAHNDAFAYVSVTSLHLFMRELQKLRRETEAKLIPYGAFHRYDSLPTISGVRLSNRALSVHSLYPRKNLARAREITSLLGGDHVHIGRNFDMSEAEYVNLALNQNVHFVGPISDTALQFAYQSAGCFICMSREEGFSMPPMEAIINGVQQIILSDILVHREIYGEYNVNFMSPDRVIGEAVPMLLTVSEKNRRDIFERFLFDRVVAPLDAFFAAGI